MSVPAGTTYLSEDWQQYIAFADEMLSDRAHGENKAKQVENSDGAK